MNRPNRGKRATLAFSLTCVTVLLLALMSLGSGCELVVHLDRSLADAGTEDVVLGVCPICSSQDGGEEGEDGETVTDGGDATTAADADAGVTLDGEAGKD